MGSDYFNEFLVNDWNALDKELSQDHFMAHEEERQEALQQQEMQGAHVSDQGDGVLSEEEMRETFNRKESKETKQDRLHRIREEYSRPFISVGAFPQRRRRRMLRLLDMLNKVEYPQQFLEQPAGESLPGPGRGFTQSVEVTEPTAKPLASAEKVLRFTKRS